MIALHDHLPILRPSHGNKRGQSLTPVRYQTREFSTYEPYEIWIPTEIHTTEMIRDERFLMDRECRIYLDIF
jgi:hypothetical protein